MISSCPRREQRKSSWDFNHEMWPPVTATNVSSLGSSRLHRHRPIIFRRDLATCAAVSDYRYLYRCFHFVPEETETFIIIKCVTTQHFLSQCRLILHSVRSLVYSLCGLTRDESWSFLCSLCHFLLLSDHCNCSPSCVYNGNVLQ